MEASGVSAYSNLIESLAGTAEFDVQKKGEATAVVEFDMGKGRKQSVWIRYLGPDRRGNSIVTISSASMKLRSGEKLDNERANFLLRENARIMHGAWAIDEGIDTGDEHDYLVITETQFVQTLDLEELIASVLAIAELSDSMESVLTGRDIF